jgi:Na+-driven multidrug efflux pump
VSYLSYIYTISFFHEKAFILYSFSLRLLFFFTTFLESFLYTFESLGTQALGEKNKEKFIQLIKNNLFVSTLATLLCLGIIVLSFSSLIHIFNIPIESLHFFRYAVLCISIALVFSNFTYIYEGILISFEKSKALLIGTFFGTIFLLSCFYLSYRFQFFEGVWIGMIGFYIIKTGIYKYYSVGALTSNLD